MMYHLFTQEENKSFHALMLSASPTESARSKRLQSRDHYQQKNKKIGCLDVVFSETDPIARWVETGDSGNYLGYPSPTSIRNDTRSSEKVK